MNRILCFAATALLAFAGNAQDLPLAPAQECRPRGGLPNFFAKATTAGARENLGGSTIATAPMFTNHFMNHRPHTSASDLT